MNKRYYWMKFPQDFFSSLRIKRLRRLAGGDTYTIIYLKMQLLSLSTSGYLEYKGVFDSFEEELAEEIQEDIDNIKITIQYLLSQGLMEQSDNSYFLPFVQENTGSETASTQRSRECRIRQKEQKVLQCNNDATLMQQTCNVDKEIEIEKEIDIEIDIEKEKKRKHKHGEFQNVLLTDMEFENLGNTYGWDMREKAIKFLDEYIEEKGNKYKSHNMAIRRWVVDAVKERERRQGKGSQEGRLDWIDGIE